MIALLQTFDALGYLFGFWAFIFSRRFRRWTLQRWREGSRLDKAWIPFEVLLATLFGVGPVLLLAIWAPTLWS